MSKPVAPSTATDALRGIINLFVGWILQVGFFIPLLNAKMRAAKTRKAQAKALAEFGGAMAAAGAGDAYLRQRIETLGMSGSAFELVQEQEKLGLSGIQAAVPLLTLEEEYRAAKAAYQANQVNEAKYDSVWARFWPQGPFSWFGLIVGYIALVVGVVVLINYLARDPKPAPAQPVITPAGPTAISTEYKGIKVVLKSAEIDRGFRTAGDPRPSTSVFFRIGLEITNTTNAPLSYITWRGHPDRRFSIAYLNDENGLKLDPYVSNAMQIPEGGVYETRIEPNGSVVDYLDFGRPAAEFQQVTLYLPTINLNPTEDNKEILSLKIPRDTVKKPGDATKSP